MAEEMASDGTSAGWANQKAAALRHFELFRAAYPQHAPLPFDELPENIVCTRQLYSRIAFFLTNEYTISEGNRNTGRHVKDTTVISSVRRLLFAAKERFPNRGMQQSRSPTTPPPPHLAITPRHPCRSHATTPPRPPRPNTTTAHLSFLLVPRSPRHVLRCRVAARHDEQREEGCP